MMNRGSFSFVAMLVINPIVILFYQNCSMTPISYAKNTTPAVVSRQIASEAKPVVADIKKPACPEDKKECAKAE
ncbi:hypothetical protein [Bdellovibrio bacteriovorus]|uniref:hypothetical protein n=1 Tax=Bdellovibrio TaxID=958 RepID=UPI0035A88AF1